MENFLFDSHAHLLDKRFRDDLSQVVKEIGRIICMYAPGEDLKLFKELLSNDFIWGAAGIHPHDAKDADVMWPKLDCALKMEKVMAVGEIGLDYYYDNSPHDTQKKVFRKQLELADKINLPVVIHSREAFEDTREILRDCKVKNALIHCFSGSARQMKEMIEQGYYIAIGGVVTFPKALQIKEVAREVPLSRLLLETDCPYLAPRQFRGKRNQPSYLKYIASEIAGIKNISIGEVARATYENTSEFFRIK